MLAIRKKDNRISFSVEDRTKFEQDKKKRKLEVIEQLQRERVKKRAASLPNKPVAVVFSNKRERNEPLFCCVVAPYFSILLVAKIVIGLFGNRPSTLI